MISLDPQRRRITKKKVFDFIEFFFFIRGHGAVYLPGLFNKLNTQNTMSYIAVFITVFIDKKVKMPLNIRKFVIMYLLFLWKISIITKIGILLVRLEKISFGKSFSKKNEETICCGVANKNVGSNCPFYSNTSLFGA